MVTIGDGVGVLLPRWSLDHRIIFFILSKGGVVSRCPIMSIVGVCSGFVYFGCPCVSPLRESSSSIVRGCRFFWVLVCVSWVM
ncbi:hypothetical protein RHGRI_009223 [Rhododendron griersonianum]|uniref:Uncharacterized protein n=1 Tax=Rhododendron griersonianum TaxID=479676 RepID=A0AAV6L4B7_9ERIC|nr:hypothetical protein RHGRI_009223 [Rhododendron griersonianum]